MQQPNFVTIHTKLTYQRDSNNIRSQTVWYTFEKKESEKLGYTKSPGRPDDNWEEWRELFSWRKPSSKDSHRSAGMRFVGANCIYEMMLCQHSAPFHIPLKQKVKQTLTDLLARLDTPLQQVNIISEPSISRRVWFLSVCLVSSALYDVNTQQGLQFSLLSSFLSHEVEKGSLLVRSQHKHKNTQTALAKLISGCAPSILPRPGERAKTHIVCIAPVATRCKCASFHRRGELCSSLSVKLSTNHRVCRSPV